ncbi:hypothetical protein MHU86_12923 [Fragilaria crotonensis]|nr:hypothetical protein MHU86_12923 [Fragilaria crotonensis]
MVNPKELEAGSLTNAGSVSIEGDLPVEGSARQLVTESPPSPPRGRRWLVPALVIMVVVMFVTIIALAVELFRNNNSDDPTGIDKATPTMSPIVMSNRKAAIETWIVQQGYSSAESLAEWTAHRAEL